MDALPPKHIVSEFDRQFEVFVEGMTRMCALCGESLEHATKACLKADKGAADHALALEDEIDYLDKTLGRTGLEMILRFSPKASDLRRILGWLRILPNLERIGDESASVAKRGRRLADAAPLPQLEALANLSDLVRELFSDAVQTIGQMNVRLAPSVVQRDATIDAVVNDFLLAIAAALETTPSADTPRLVDLLFITRSLERVGDHCKNIAEAVIYMATGEDVR